MSKSRSKRAVKPVQKHLPWPWIVMAAGAVLIIVFGFLVWRTNSSGQTSDTAEPTAGARLEVDRDTIDFGPVPLNQRVNAIFKLKNTGDQPLRILGEPTVELVQGC